MYIIICPIASFRHLSSIAISISYFTAMNSKLFLTAILVALIGILIAINGIGILSKSIFLDNTEKHWQYLKVIKAVVGIGPESFAFDPLGKGPYTGISDGRIIRLDENGSQWTNFAVTSSNR